MKKILLAFIVLVLASCDPEHVFVESQAAPRTTEKVETVEFTRKVLYRNTDLETRKDIEVIQYDGHEYLIVYCRGAYGVDVEIVEVTKNDTGGDTRQDQSY